METCDFFKGSSSYSWKNSSIVIFLDCIISIAIGSLILAFLRSGFSLRSFYTSSLTSTTFLGRPLGFFSSISISSSFSTSDDSLSDDGKIGLASTTFLGLPRGFFTFKSSSAFASTIFFGRPLGFLTGYSRRVSTWSDASTIFFGRPRYFLTG